MGTRMTENPSNTTVAHMPMAARCQSMPIHAGSAHDVKPLHLVLRREAVKAKECMLCCEAIPEGQHLSCKPLDAKQDAHVFCAECLAKQTARVTSSELPFEAVQPSEGKVLCPFTLDAHAWKHIKDLHDAGIYENTVNGTFTSTDHASGIFECFERMAFAQSHMDALDALKRCGCTSDAFTDRTIAKVVPNDEAYERYMACRHRVLGDKAFQEAQGALDMIVNRLRAAREYRERFHCANVLLAKQLQIRLGDTARQCKRCGFGPMDYFGCNDLQAHQGQIIAVNADGQARAVISNACPKCGWFSPFIHEWPKWNGELAPDFDLDFDSIFEPIQVGPQR